VIVGITGGAGSGKTSVASFFRDAGWTVVDVDQMAQTLILENRTIQDQLKAAFGTEYFQNEKLNRRELGRKVFSDPVLLKKLNAIVWPEMISQLKAHLDGLRKKKKDIAVDMAVLFEAGCQQLVDYVLLITASSETRKARLKSRSWTSEEIEQRMAAQWADAVKMRQADWVIHNEGNLEELRAQTEIFILRIRKGWMHRKES
jgi:dephospho-CoA kinase